VLKASVRARLDRGSTLVAAVGAIAYPLALHLAPQVQLLGPIVAVLVIALLVRLMLSSLERPYKLLGAVLAATLVLGAVVAGPARMLRWQPALLNLTLMCACAYSLHRGMPLIERIARARRMPVGSHNRIYLRRLTAVWGGFFAVASALSLLGATVAPDVWLRWNGLGVYAAIVLLIVGERLYRIRYRRRLARDGLLPECDM